MAPARVDASAFSEHVTVREPLFVLESGEIENQPPEMMTAVQAIVPLPLLLTFTTCVPPAAIKDKLFGKTLNFEVVSGVVGVFLQPNRDKTRARRIAPFFILSPHLY
jgi:hypothetical protein